MPLDPRSLPSFFNDSLLKHLFNCNKEAMNNYCWISALFIYCNWKGASTVIFPSSSSSPCSLSSVWYGEISSFFPPPHKTLLYLSHSTYNLTITNLLIPHNHMHPFNSLIVPLPTKRCCICPILRAYNMTSSLITHNHMHPFIVCDPSTSLHPLGVW